MMGSSPLARGTPFGVDVTPLGDGLIPARAGNTVLLGCSSSVSRAHPRSRGEHEILQDGVAAGDGSSPLARGTPLAPGEGAALGGAHPRSRGEHLEYFAFTSPVAGSSPLARGTLLGTMFAA